MTTRPPRRGIEQLLVAAASDPELAARLRDDPAATVAACTSLSPTEREVLASVPPESLRQMVAAVVEGAQDRRSFLQQSGAMLGVFAAGGGGGGGGYGGARADVPGSEVRLDEVKVRGPLSREIVRRLLRRNVNQVRYCYERERQRYPALAGKVTVGFAIKIDGTVGESAVKASTVGNKELESCIAAGPRRGQFPKPSAVVTVECTYSMRPPR